MIRIDMLQLLRDAQAAHHAAEQRLPPHDWTVWYAAFIESRIADAYAPHRFHEDGADNAVTLALEMAHVGTGNLNDVGGAS